MSDLPTIREELERKTLETYDWLMQRSSTGQFGSSEVRVALQTIFNITSGLIDREITDAAAAVEFESEYNHTHKRIYRVGHIVFVVSWTMGSSEVRVLTIKHDGTAEKVYECDDSRDGLRKFALICQAMKSKGATEIA